MTSKKTLLSLAAVAAAVAVSGCVHDEYFERRDTITIGAGDAVARNRAVQTIHPRPRHAYRKRLLHDGTRINNAMESYRDASSSSDDSDTSDTQNANTEPNMPTPALQ